MKHKQKNNPGSPVGSMHSLLHYILPTPVTQQAGKKKEKEKKNQCNPHSQTGGRGEGGGSPPRITPSGCLHPQQLATILQIGRRSHVTKTLWCGGTDLGVGWGKYMSE